MRWSERADRDGGNNRMKETKMTSAKVRLDSILNKQNGCKTMNKSNNTWKKVSFESHIIVIAGSVDEAIEIASNSKPSYWDKGELVVTNA